MQPFITAVPEYAFQTKPKFWIPWNQTDELKSVPGVRPCYIISLDGVQITCFLPLYVELFAFILVLILPIMFVDCMMKLFFYGAKILLV